MIEEAEKYLGMPYVWGGSSPSTSFDCSGFVCWVINNCGNGWSVGRTTANGLRGKCSYVSPADAQPGDLIFFEKTYNTAGASHVGIYVGNGMQRRLWTKRDVHGRDGGADAERAEQDRKSTRLNSSHSAKSRMPSSA